MRRDFKQWFLALDGDQRDEVARAAECSRRYIEVSLVNRRKLPRPNLVERLAGACAQYGGPTHDDLLRFFYK
jgi:hypothetical protein